MAFQEHHIPHLKVCESQNGLCRIQIVEGISDGESARFSLSLNCKIQDSHAQPNLET